MEEFSVLLVDDEEDFLRTIIKRLSKRGIRAQGASRANRPWPCWPRNRGTWWSWT